jgi:hypothetical protein
MNLETNGGSIDVLTIVDTGTQKTLVSAEFALPLGLTINAGTKTPFTPMSGHTIYGYGHPVRVTIFGERLDLEICFAETKLERCLLGRDVLQLMQIGLNESLSTLYLF